MGYGVGSLFWTHTHTHDPCGLPIPTLGPKHTEVVNIGQLPLKHFVGGAPVQASYRSMVMDVGFVSECIFPPRVRDAGLMPHRLGLIHESVP